MKEFDIEKIGKKMPYSLPSEEFFDDFKSNMMQRLESERSIKRRNRARLLLPMVAAAATLLMGIFIAQIEHSPKSADLTADNLDTQIEAYINSLSDDELAYLAAKESPNEDFFLILSNN